MPLPFTPPDALHCRRSPAHLPPPTPSAAPVLRQICAPPAPSTPAAPPVRAPPQPTGTASERLAGVAPVRAVPRCGPPAKRAAHSAPYRAAQDPPLERRRPWGLAALKIRPWSLASLHIRLHAPLPQVWQSRLN